jgi:peptidoglycan hydrolase-like protein with peptidoglycan-binding domain
MRVDLGDPGDRLIHADYDGRFWVGSFADEVAEQADAPRLPNRVIVVDTDADTPAAVDAGCAAGVAATLDRLGTAQPAPSPTTTAPPTTVAPTSPAPSTTPGQCGDYVTADNDYPVRRCEQGAPVHGVQLMLIRRGFDIEPDGYFGPATEAAVRQFQASVGVAVDGLVGIDTWTALYDPSYLPGNDNNDNGMIDPWELILDPGPIGLSVSFSPTSPPPGGTIEVTGSGCEPGEDVIVWTQGATGTGTAFEYPVMLPATADNSGSVVASTTISDALAPGDGFSVGLICGDMPPAPEDAVFVDGTVGAVVDGTVGA